MTVKELKQELWQNASGEKAAFMPRFFKAGPGEYAEGDKFLGVTVPIQRKVAVKFKDLSLADAEKLLASPWHEERLTALFILVGQFKIADKNKQAQIYDLYLKSTKNINNWDLVDSSAEHIVGAFLAGRPEKMTVLNQLAESGLLWERRIAMISTYHYIKQGKPGEALEIADKLLSDQHDLINKAVGWMLREIGKRCDHTLLVDYLRPRYKTMPRTTLRYAIEHFSELERKKYLAGTI